MMIDLTGNLLEREGMRGRGERGVREGKGEGKGREKGGREGRRRKGEGGRDW